MIFFLGSIWYSFCVMSTEKQKKTILQKKQKEVSNADEIDKGMGSSSDLEQSITVFLEIIDEMCESYRELEMVLMSLVESVVKALDSRYHCFRNHSVNVAAYAERIGIAFGLDQEEQKRLRLAGLLHDIGRIGLEDMLLKKTTKISAYEFEKFQKHALYGALILKRVHQLHDIVPLIMHHHERMDGNGYPEGLAGESIPLGARILHVADSFDAMVTGRPYKADFGRTYAFSEFLKNKGTQFDKQIVDIAIQIL